MTNIDVSTLKNPNQPREIRARTGQLEDPLPEGKKIEEKEWVSDHAVHISTDPCKLYSRFSWTIHFRSTARRDAVFRCRFPNITPAKHDSSDQPELSKEELEAHKEGLKQMQKKDPKHGGEPNSLSKKDHIGSSVEMHGRSASTHLLPSFCIRE